MIFHCVESNGPQQEVEMDQHLPSFLQINFKSHLCKNYPKKASRENFSQMFLMSLLLGGICLTCGMIGNSGEWLSRRSLEEEPCVVITSYSTIFVDAGVLYLSMNVDVWYQDAVLLLKMTQRRLVKEM